jgi:tRNA G46 methylase TrmB
VFANSREVTSTQTRPHPRLGEIVRRHLHVPYRREPGTAGRAAFATVAGRLAAAPFVLDAGCGTGASTLVLARALPDQFVLGIDKSASRLGTARESAIPGNAMHLRCDLVDFWQLAAAAGVRCARQYLLYPNPWPKPELLKRRWHAHPALPAILALGGAIELRTNWRIYAEEFAQSLRIAGRDVDCEEFVPEAAASPFEAKYLASGHRLWRCRAI